MLAILKNVLKSRTVRFNLLIGLLGVLQGFVFLIPVSPIQQAIIVAVIVVANILLRAVTDSPLFKKEA